MKYVGGRFFCSGVMGMETACSKCGKECGHDDMYCRACGRKLDNLPGTVDSESAMKALTRAAKKGDLAVGGKVSGPCVVASAGACSSSSPHCPRGRADNVGCSALGCDGRCNDCVFLTSPPQRDMCPYVYTAVAANPTAGDDGLSANLPAPEGDGL